MNRALSGRWILLVTFLFALTAAFMFATSAAADEIEDIDSSHWAYESVKQLVEQGYMTLYADDTFRGEDPVSRYTLAEVVAKLLENMEKGIISPTDEDYKTIQELTTEFRDELVSLAEETGALEEQLKELEERESILQLRHADLRDDMSGIKGEVDDIMARLEQDKEYREQRDREFSDLTGNIERVEGDLDTIQSQYEELASRIKEHPIDDPELLARIREQEEESLERIRGLERKVDNLRRELASYQSAQDEELASLHRRSTNMTIAAAGAIILLLITGL